MSILSTQTKYPFAQDVSYMSRTHQTADLDYDDEHSMRLSMQYPNGREIIVNDEVGGINEKTYNNRTKTATVTMIIKFICHQ